MKGKGSMRRGEKTKCRRDEVKRVDSKQEEREGSEEIGKETREEKQRRGIT